MEREFNAYKTGLHDRLIQLKSAWDDTVAEARDSAPAGANSETVWADKVSSGIQDLMLLCEGAVSRDGLYRALELYDGSARAPASADVKKLAERVKVSVGDLALPSYRDLAKVLE